MNRASAPALVGPTFLAATLASLLIGALPSFVGGASLLHTWLLASASIALLLAPAALGFAARGRESGRALWSVGTGLGLSLAPLMLLGGLLKTATHHRPLGAATFAAIACFAALGSIVFCWRLRTLSESLSESQGRLIRSVVGALALLSGGWVLMRLARLATSADFLVAYAELGLVIATLWIASRDALRERLARVPAAVGVALWLVVVLSGAILALTWNAAGTGPTTAVLWLLFAP